MLNKKYVLLDIDGTLVDSNAAHASSWQKALASQGRQHSFDEILKLIGKGGDHLLPELVGVSSKSEKGKCLSRVRGAIFKAEYLDGLRAFDGSLELLEKLKDSGHCLVVATSASKEDGLAILEKFGFDKIVDVVTCSADASHSKPDADIILAALEKAGASASASVMIGDTPYDISAAIEAQVAVIAFSSKLWTARQLKYANQIFTGPRDMLEKLRHGFLTL